MAWDSTDEASSLALALAKGYVQRDAEAVTALLAPLQITRNPDTDPVGHYAQQAQWAALVRSLCALLEFMSEDYLEDRAALVGWVEVHQQGLREAAAEQ